MFNDQEEMDLNIHGLNVFGDVMLVLFVAILVTTTVAVNSQLIKNSPLGGSAGDEPPPIGLEVIVGPGESIKVNGQPVALETMLARAEKIPAKKQVQVQMDTAGDPALYFKVRYELRNRGCGFVEAPPQKTDTNKGERQ